MRFENKRSQNEKKRKKKHILQLEKKISLPLFLAGPLTLHFKDDL
jgi:hypothetical protein